MKWTSSLIALVRSLNVLMSFSCYWKFRFKCIAWMPLDVNTYVIFWTPISRMNIFLCFYLTQQNVWNKTSNPKYTYSWSMLNVMRHVWSVYLYGCISRPYVLWGLTLEYSWGCFYEIDDDLSNPPTSIEIIFIGLSI